MSKNSAVIPNKLAEHNYFLLEKYEAGIELTGCEVKSVAAGKCSIKEAYARIDGSEIYVYGMNVSPYENGTYNNPDPLRPKRLLLHKSEIRKIAGSIAEDGLTLVPVKIYFTDKGKAKMELAVARGKKNYDKRESIKAKDVKRETARAFKVRNL